MSGRHALYRLYAADGELLYIGETSWPTDRMRHHKRDKPWWPQVDRIDIVWYDSFREALDAEAAAIAAELPKWNKRGIPGFKPNRMPRKVDYRELLRKYIEHVGVSEGTNFLSDWHRDDSRTEVEFRDNEWQALQMLAAEAGGE